MPYKTHIRSALLGILLLAHLAAQGQRLYFSRFLPGSSAGYDDAVRRVELFNESSATRDISGFTLLTKHYVYRLPARTTIPAMQSLRIGWRANGDAALELSTQGEGYARNSAGKDPGGYALLLDRQMNIVDAFYYGRRSSVGFLPDEEMFKSSQGETRIQVPDESDRRWSFIPDPGDPAISFVRVAGEWRPNSKSRNFVPATAYNLVQTQYVDGIVTVKWSTRFEKDCYFHVVERSTDGKNFREIERVRTVGNNPGGQAYSFYDPKVEKDRVYFYRISNLDKFGNLLYSEPARVRTEVSPDGFTFDVIRDEDRRSLSVRFSSRDSQQVRIELLDEELRKISTLYLGDAEAEKQNLVSYNQSLPIGKYFVIVSTEERRFYEPFIME